MTDFSDIQKGTELDLLVAALPPGRIEESELATGTSAVLADESLRDGASEAVNDIAEAKINVLPGGMSARLGRTHIKLRKLIRSAACSVFFLGVATTEPTGISLVAGVEQGVEFLITFAELLKRLTDTEVMVYDIVAELEAKNRWLSIKPDAKRGTEWDIRSVILERGFGIPKDFSTALASLNTKGAIEAAPGPGDEPIYVTVH